MLDFARESTKYLTFRVDGLDAAALHPADGIHQHLRHRHLRRRHPDAVRPIAAAGSSAAGWSPGRTGGTLSYVGELTDEDLGAYGKLAFDALKSLRYSRFDITLDGDLAGEFLTRIDLDGIARDPVGTRQPAGGISGMVVSRVLGQLARIPFDFNIRIQGPFRALIATARSFADPSELIRAALPGLLDSQTPPDHSHSASGKRARAMTATNLTNEGRDASRRDMERIGRFCLAAGVAAGLAGCVKVTAPDRPIEINLNITIRQEVVVRLQRDAQELIQNNPGVF